MRTPILVMALSAALAMGCDSKEGDLPSEPVACTEGDSKDANDGCNTCVCLESGDWECTELECVFTSGPCEGLVCGDPCTNCAEGEACLGVETFCQANGDCNANSTPNCDEEPPPGPCEGKACGASCSQGQPGSGGADGLTVEMYCQADGTCNANAMPNCEEEPTPNPCEDLACGEVCFPDIGTEGGVPDSDVAPHVCGGQGACVPSWEFDTEACEEQPPTSQCYSTEGCGEGQICTVDLGECSACDDCPMCAVCCGECIADAAVVSGEANACTDPEASDAYEVSKFDLTWDEQEVRLDVAYSGGCAEHVFTACYAFGEPVNPRSMEEAPDADTPTEDAAYPTVDAYLTVIHDADGDMCEAYPEQTIAFGITELKEMAKVEANSEKVILFLHLVGTDDKLNIFVND